MNEEEKKVEKQEQLFDLGNGRFVDVNKLILVAQQDDNQDLYTSSWSLGSRRNAIKTSINETLQAIKDGVVTGRNANKTYNFNKDILQQTGKHFDPNSAALDYLNWIFDSEQAPEDFYTQPKPKEEPKKEGPKKYTGSYEETLSKLFPSMEVWNDRDKDDNTLVISGNTNRISQAVEAAQKHLMENKGYDFSESTYYKNELEFEEAMNAIIEAGRSGNMDDLIAAMSRTGGFKGVNNIRDTYFGIPKIEEKPVVVETEEQKAYKEKQKQYKLFLELQNRNKDMAKMDWEMGYYTNNIVPNFIKFSNTSNLPELTQGELLPYFTIPTGVAKDKENEHKLKLEKFADNAHKTLLKYLSGTPINWNQNISEQLTKYLNWYFDPSEESNKEFGRGYYWNPELINKDNAHFYVYNPETRHLLVKSFDEANDEIKAILEAYHKNKFETNYGKKLNGGTLNKLKQLRKGGIIKAQNGREINWVYESDYNKAQKKEKVNDPNLKDPNWVIATDSIGALADLGSLIMSFTGVGSFWSAVPGVIGSSLDFAGNWGRDGLDWRDARNFAINLGSDALGMIPGLGVSSKVAKVSKALPTIITSLAALNVGLDSLNILKKVLDNNGDWSVVTSDEWFSLAQSVLPAVGGVNRMIGNKKASNRILAGMDRGKTRQEALDIVKNKATGATKGGVERIDKFTQENKKFENLMDDWFGSKKIQTEHPKQKTENKEGVLETLAKKIGEKVGKLKKAFKEGMSEEKPKTNKKDSNLKKEQGGKLNQLKALRKGGVLIMQTGGEFEEFKKYLQAKGVDPSIFDEASYKFTEESNPYLTGEAQRLKVLNEIASEDEIDTNEQIFNEEIQALIDSDVAQLRIENPNLDLDIKPFRERNTKEESFEDALQTYQRNAAGKRPNVGGEDLYKKVSGLYDLALLGIKNDSIANYAKEMGDLYLDNVFRPTAHQIQAPKVTNLFELRMLKQQQDAQDFYKVGQNLSALNPDLYRQHMLGLVSSLANSDMQLNMLERAHLDQLYLNLAEVDNTNAKARLDAYLEGLKNQLSANVTTGAMLAEANKAIQNNWGDYMTQLKLNQQQDVKDWNAALLRDRSYEAQKAYDTALLNAPEDPSEFYKYMTPYINLLKNVYNEENKKIYGFKTKQTGPNFNALSAKKGGKLDSETKLQIENSRFLSKQIIQLLKNRDKGLDRLSKITYKTILKSLGLE